MQPKEYEALYTTEEHLWWFRALHMFLLRLIPNQALGSTALDIGCGTGGLLRKLETDGYKVSGLDRSDVALSYACRDLSALARASANEVPLTKAFDLVVSVDVLEVREVDPNRLVREAIRVLRPGGHAAFVVAAHQWLLSAHDQAVDSVRRFDKAQLTNLLKEHNVTILRSSYLFFFLFPIVALRKLLNPPQPGKQVLSDVSVPPFIVNSLLFAICWFEAQILRFVDLPVGSSVVVVVRKNA